MLYRIIEKEYQRKDELVRKLKGFKNLSEKEKERKKVQLEEENFKINALKKQIDVNNALQELTKRDGKEQMTVYEVRKMLRKCVAE